MPKIAEKHFLSCAEVLVAALLCHANGGQFTGNAELQEFRVSEECIYIQATPSALLAMVDFYLTMDRFPCTKTTIGAFEKISRADRYAIMRDTVTQMGKRQFIDESPRQRGNPIQTRTFSLPLGASPTEMDAVMQWFRRELKDRHPAQTPQANLPPEFREANKLLSQALDAAACLFPEKLRDFTRSQRQRLVDYLPYITTALTQPQYSDLHPKLALNLAKFYLATGKGELALPLLQRCLTLNEESQANGYHYLGVFYLGSGAWLEALKYYQKALELRQRRSPRNDFAIGATYLGLAHTLTGLRKFEQANWYIQATLSMQQGCSELWADALRLRGEIHLTQARWEESWQDFEQALQFCGPPNQNNIATFAACLRGRGRWFAWQRAYANARTEWQTAITALEDQDDEHHLLVWLLADRARTWEMQGEISEARRHYERALQKAQASGTTGAMVVPLIEQGLERLASQIQYQSS